MSLEYWYMLPVSVATSVFVVAVTALTAATGHLVQFARAEGDALSTALSIAIFTVPGVIVGAQLGSALSGRLSQHALERGLGILFILIAALTLGEAIL